MDSTHPYPDFVAGEVYCSGDVADYTMEWWCDGSASLHDPKLVIWLPRQDQLQEMVGQYGHFQPFTNALHDFTKWYESQLMVYHESENFEQVESQWGSMEQLWLAFVMKEKHGKTWNGNQWESVCLG